MAVEPAKGEAGAAVAVEPAKRGACAVVAVEPAKGEAYAVVAVAMSGATLQEGPKAAETAVGTLAGAVGSLATQHTVVGEVVGG